MMAPFLILEVVVEDPISCSANVYKSNLLEVSILYGLTPLV